MKKSKTKQEVMVLSHLSHSAEHTHTQTDTQTDTHTHLLQGYESLGGLLATIKCSDACCVTK